MTQEREEGTVRPQIRGGSPDVRLSLQQSPKGSAAFLAMLKKGLNVRVAWHHCRGHNCDHYYLQFPGEPVPWCQLENANPVIPA